MAVGSRLLLKRPPRPSPDGSSLASNFDCVSFACAPLRSSDGALDVLTHIDALSAGGDFAGGADVRVAIFFNSGNGVMTSSGPVSGAAAHAACTLTTNGAGRSFCMAKCLRAGDLDGDGDADFIDCAGNVHLNDGSGTAFATATLTPLTSNDAGYGAGAKSDIMNLQLGDLDEDGCDLPAPARP